jgi:hypothetical protein
VTASDAATPRRGRVGVEHREGAGVAVARRGDEADADGKCGRQAALAGTDDDDVHRRGGGDVFPAAPDVPDLDVGSTP